MVSTVHATIERLNAFSAATLYEAQRRGCLPAFLKPLYRGIRLCGRAFTVTCWPGDNLPLHYALSQAEPGDVLVVEAGGYPGAGLWGDVMTTAAQARGVTGLIVNGAVRDACIVSEMRFPVFSRSLCMKGGSKRVEGTLREPIVWGGERIEHGDFLVGDDDGVVVIGRQNLDATLAAAAEREAREEAFRKRLLEGETTVELFGLGPMLESVGMSRSAAAQ